MKLYIVAGCLLLSIFFNNCFASANDSVLIRVHFLHGSKPKRAFKETEDRWFGGLLGGHAGIEYEPNKVLNFQPKSRFHLFSNRSIINSKFSIHDTISFYEILGGNYDSVKKTIVCIKISSIQKTKLDSIVKVYTKRSPYDYAFFGMRCGAAAYDVLAQIDVVRPLSLKKTWRRIFYPRRLRRRLEALAKIHDYKVIKVEGCKRRKWEQD